MFSLAVFTSATKTIKLKLQVKGFYMSFVENKRIVQEFLDETYNKGNLKNTDRFVTPDFIYHARGEDIEGIEAYNEWVSSDRSIFPDIQLTMVDSIAEFGKVASAFIVEGTHEKEFRGMPATHKKFETVGMNIFYFQDNKIREGWVVVDALTAALQLGAVKAISSDAD
ncbi:MAG: ester cyclase [Nitrososphaeraceae archaeon]